MASILIMRPPVHCFNTQPPEGGWGQFWGGAFPICVSTHSRPKAAGDWFVGSEKVVLFQHTAARRRLGVGFLLPFSPLLFQHTAARRRLGAFETLTTAGSEVSTHSRPKAAGFVQFDKFDVGGSFNTQPPEGGWLRYMSRETREKIVSTHSRPKAAGPNLLIFKHLLPVSTHSRPKAAGDGRTISAKELQVSTHSRPKAAGTRQPMLRAQKSFNTQPPEGGWLQKPRRRSHRRSVSTHSRPKAAGP